MMNKPRILVIDDEPQMGRLLEITLSSNDYEVAIATTAKAGMVQAANHPPDAILLDLGLPDLDGQEALRQLREWFTHPILIVSVLSEESAIVRALDSGANDYITKPFRTGELLARLRSALRGTAREAASVVRVGLLEIDLAGRSVRNNGQLLKLTATEYALLALLARHEGKVLTHHYLLREVWGPGYLNQSQYLRVYIAQLRKKIEEDPNRPRYLLTDSGIGYRLAGSD